MAPIWRATRTRVGDALGSSRVARTSRIARSLAGVEVAAAFVLAAGALTMLQSFAALTRTDLLFRTERLLTLSLELPQTRYGTPAQRGRAGAELLDRLRAIPGVEAAVIWGPSMFARSTWVAFLLPADRVTADNERLMVSRHSTNPGALADLGIRLVRGRDFTRTDTLEAPPVAILSETAAARLWPGQDAVGRQFRTGAASSVPLTVIGVAADVRHRGRFRFSSGSAADEPQLDIYLPFAQRPNALVTLGVRTTAAPSTYTTALRSAVASFDPTLPTFDIASLEERMKSEEAPLAFAALLINVYGGLAWLLAAIGVYSVLAAAVASRTRELGIKSALGADPRRLTAAIVGEGLVVASAAVAVGTIAAWALARSFSGALFGVSGHTGRTLAAAAVLLIATAVASSLVPARRAARVDPVTALRHD
jgi:putative ABC transport system permease protein